MKVYGVYSYTGFGLNGEVQALHARGWAADWHAYALALQMSLGTPRWLASPAWGPPGWTSAELPLADCADVWVMPQPIRQP